MITIEPFAAKQFAAISALWNEAFPDKSPWNEASIVIAEKLRMQPELFLVAVDDGIAIGSITAGYDGHRGWLSRVAVRRTHQQRGIGRLLIAEAEQRLRAIGCSKINLQIVTSNAAVVSFYERRGYRTEPRISMGKRLAD